MRKRSIVLLAGAAAIAATLVVGPTATASSDRASAGTVVFIHDQEPPNLQGPWVGNNLYATSLVLNNIWYGGQIRDGKANFVPKLFTGAPKITKKKPLTVTLEYRKDANWSDGKPVTANDLRATWQVFINPKNNVISRTGWEDVKSIAAKGKKAIVVFKKQYADWEALLSSGPYAAHVIAGQDMNQMFLNSIAVSSGPWRFDSWQKGVQLSVRKNPNFKAGTPMKLDRVVFRYILDTNARFQALKAGEGQVMEPQPQLQIADFLKDKKFVVDQKIGYAWEHVDIQFGPQGHAALKQPYVRQALITGINRKQIAGALYVDDRPGACLSSTATCSSPSRATTSRTGLSTSSASRRSSTFCRRRVAPVGRASPREQPGHLQLPERRQAVVPLRHHDRQPAPRARLRDHAEAAQERRNRARRSLSRWPARCSARRFRRVTGTWRCSRGSAARRLRSRSRTCTPVVATRTT